MCDAKNRFENYDGLISKGDMAQRIDVLSILEAGIQKAIPYQTTKDLLSITDNVLHVGKRTYNLDEIDHIYVIGAGKGSYPIALALDEVLGDRITQGIIIVKEGEKRRLTHIDTFESSHPIPDGRSIVAGEKLVDVLQKTTHRDLVFAAITGGSSAMVNAPMAPITLDELKQLNISLQKCGAPIGQINAVRKHVCRLKGGRFLAQAAPAKIITFTFDTSPPDMPWPDMCLPDPTTFDDALNVLHEYNIAGEIAPSIMGILQAGKRGELAETVKDISAFDSVIYSVADPQSCCEAAAQKAKELGYHTMLLSSMLEGEAKDVGIFMAGIANECITGQGPIPLPCAVISGGETTVTIHDQCGMGGPNQESALGFASKWRKDAPVAFAAVDTDGTDGPGVIAGGIVDSHSRKRAVAQDISLMDTLVRHDASTALLALDDALITGHTGTNVMNLRVLIVGGEERNPPAKTILHESKR